MPKRRVIVVLGSALSVGLILGGALAIGPIQVGSVEAVPSFARQYDLQCNACHTRPPRLNSFGEQFHLMGFQMPSAARPGGLLAAYKEDGPLKFLLDTVSLRAVGNIFEFTYSPEESERKFAPPDEIELFITRPITPDLSVYVEIEYEPNGVSFENGRYFNEGTVGVGKEAFFMLNLGRVLGWLGAPTMEMGGMTMVGRHGGFNLHGPMMMAGKIDPSTNFSYATNRQLIVDTELEIKDSEVERLPIVPYAFTSKFFGLFKNRDEAEPLLATDQVMYNTTGQPGVDLHAMFMNNQFLGQVGFMAENGGFNTYGVFRFDIGQRDDFTFNASALVNWGFGNQFAPDPADLDHPGERVDRLRLGLAANARWKRLDMYGAVTWDKLYNLPRGLGDFKRTAAGLTVQADYLALEQVMLSSRFDQLWAGGVNDQRQNGSVFTVQARYYPWPNIAFFIRNSTNLRTVVHDNPLRNWRNQFFIGMDWDF